MRGKVGINYLEQPYRVINNNYRNILCLVAPFKDDSFVFKAYNSLKEAVKGEKTLKAEAKGYHYLELLYKYFPEMPEIVLCNTTTNDAAQGEDPDYNYELTNDRLGEIFEELDEVGISLLTIPEQLTVPQYVMYKTFYDEQRNIMNAFGLVHQTSPRKMATNDAQGNTIPSTSLLNVLFHLGDMDPDGSIEGKPDGLFATGGSWFTVTTRAKRFDEEPLTMEDSVVYFAGLLANTPENVSGTHLILDGVEGLITKQQYGTQDFNLIINTGAIAVNYRDKIHKVCQIYNSGTQNWNEQLDDTYDLKIERTHALIINEVKIGLLNLIGDDNDQVSYDDFESVVRDVRDTYKPGYISDLEWKVTKTGSPEILVHIQEKQKNIITTINVVGTMIID